MDGVVKHPFQIDNHFRYAIIRYDNDRYTNTDQRKDQTRRAWTLRRDFPQRQHHYHGVRCESAQTDIRQDAGTGTEHHHEDTPGRTGHRGFIHTRGRGTEGHRGHAGRQTGELPTTGQG